MMACSPSIRSRVIPSYGTRRRANPGDIGFGSATVALFSLSRGAARGFHNFGDSERQDAPICYLTGALLSRCLHSNFAMLAATQHADDAIHYQNHKATQKHIRGKLARSGSTNASIRVN